MTIECDALSPAARYMATGSILSALHRWQKEQGLGKRAGTQKFHAEILAVIMAKLKGLDRPIEELTADEIADFAQEIAHYCPSRFNAFVSVIRSITGNPKILKYRKLKFRDFKPPSQEEFSALLLECDMSPRSCCGLLVRLLSVTGLRIAEAQKLKWEHVGENALMLPGEITKNGKPRSIPLLPGAREILHRLKAFGNPEFVIPVKGVRTALTKACRRAGIPYLSYHIYRHWFASRCIESGVDIPTVSRWLGHSDGGALLTRIYFHLRSDHSTRMAEKVRIAV